jgi:MFS family permease
VRRDFWLFWCGQTVSELGTAFTLFALPLLVYKLTGSAVDLGIATAAGFLPYLLFGLVIGAWVDRLHRRPVMIAADVCRAAAIVTIPVLAGLGVLHVWWIYGVSFAVATLSIAFGAGTFAAVPGLVGKDDLVAANGRLTAGMHAAHVLGPILAGALLGLGIPTASVLYADAASFLVSAASVALIATSLGGGRDGSRARASIVSDVGEGLRFVVATPLLRDLALLTGLANFIGATQWAQLVLFAKERLDATDVQISVMWAAGSAGALVLAVAAARIRRHVGFGQAVLGAAAVQGVVGVVFAMTTSYTLALLRWSVRIGVGQFGGINSTSVRQAVTPPELLARVGTIGQVLSWSAIPAGALVGGWAIEASGSVVRVYAAIGLLFLLLAAAFGLGTIRHADTHVAAAATRG